MKLFFILLSLLPIHAICQTDTIPRNAEGKYEYTEVVKVDSASAEKLYSNAKLFIVDAFKSGKDVTQLTDDNTKTVVGKGTVKIVLKGLLGSGIDKYVRFKITIQCKDGKYRYNINEFEASFHSSQYDGVFPLEDDYHMRNKVLSKKQIIEFDKDVNADVNLIIIDLKKHMASQTDNTKDF